jgi:hypothetical protein
MLYFYVAYVRVSRNTTSWVGTSTGTSTHRKICPSRHQVQNPPVRDPASTKRNQSTVLYHSSLFIVLINETHSILSSKLADIIYGEWKKNIVREPCQPLCRYRSFALPNYFPEKSIIHTNHIMCPESINHLIILIARP